MNNTLTLAGSLSPCLVSFFDCDKPIYMPARLVRLCLPLCACLLLFTQCEVIRYLTTEPGTPTKTTPSRTPPAKEKSDYELQLRREVVDYAKQQVGARYKYAGRSPKQGFDCSGFTYYVLDNFDIRISPSSRAQEQEGKKIDVAAAQTGDLIFFRRSKAGAVFHVAMVVSNGRDGLTVVHSTSRGVVVDNISKSKYWKPKISTARDIIGR